MPLDKKADAGDWVDDFYKSDAPQFKGKSKKKRRQMAIAAYLNKKNEGTMIKSNALEDLVSDLTEGIRVEPLVSSGRTSAERAAGAGSHVAGGGRTDAEKAAGAGIKKRVKPIPKPKPKSYTIQAGYDPSLKEAGWTDRKDPTPSGGDLKKKEKAHKDAMAIHKRVMGKRGDHVDAYNAHGHALNQLNKVVMASPKSHKAFQAASDDAMKKSATAQPGFLPWQKGHPTHEETPWKHLGRIPSPPKDGPFAPRKEGAGYQWPTPRPGLKPVLRKTHHLDDHDNTDTDFVKLAKKHNVKHKATSDGTMLSGHPDNIKKILHVMPSRSASEFKEGSQKPYVSFDSGHPDGPQAHVMNSQGEVHKSWPMKHKQKAMNYLHKNYDKLRESNVPTIGRVSDLKRKYDTVSDAKSAKQSKGQAARTMAMATGDHGKITMDDYTTDGGGGPHLHKQYGLKKTIHKDADGKRINHWSGGHKVSLQGSHKGLHDYAVNHLGYSRPGHLSGHPGPTNTDAIQQHIGGSAAKAYGIPRGKSKETAHDREMERQIRTFKNKKNPNKVTEEFNFEVDIEGLPKLFMYASGPGDVKAKLRKIVKQPSMINAVTRVTDATVRKTFRMKAQGKVDDKQDAYAESALHERVGPTLKLKDFKVGMYIQTKTGNVGQIIANEPRGDNLVVKMNKGGKEVNMNWKQLGLYTKPRLKGLMHSRGRMGMR